MGRSHKDRGPWLRVTGGLAVLLLSGSVLGGCFTIGKTVQARDTVELSLAVAAGTPARIETFNGGIDVSVSSGPVVTAAVARTGEGADEAEAEADRDSIGVTLELVDGVAVLRAVYAPSPASISAGRGATVTLLVPASTPLELLTSNGPIRVRDISGGVDARTSNGPVELRGVDGTLAVDTSNGPVTVSTTAPVALDVHTSNGGITFDGSLQPGGVTLETSNGPVDVLLPPDAAFTIDAATSSSKSTTEFEIEGTTSDTELSGTVGEPDEAAATRITLRTSNGPVTLRTR